VADALARELADGDEVVRAVGDPLFGPDLAVGRVDVAVGRQRVKRGNPGDV